MGDGVADQVGEWLEQLGLGEYAETFAQNKIKFEHLRDLSEDDLKELGIMAMGDRKALMRAIAATGEVEMAEPGADRPDEMPRRGGEAERRQLTLMFVDLVGSTELSGRLDPEEMRDVLRSYQNAVAGEVTRFDGSVAKYMGDGVLCYFGWPMAHEDDAERAVRAGLSVMQVLGKVTTAAGEPIGARAGVATGLVVVGDLIGEGSSEEQAVVGETPNLAARVQGLAQPGQVVVAEPTRQLLGDVFELSDLGPRELRGIAGKINAYVVTAERAAESRFEARSSGAVSAMVGRKHELALMSQRWKQARAGEGQLLLLTGEAGIGKSRITRAMIDFAAGEPHVRISYQCSPYHTDSSFYPAVQQLIFAAGIKAGDSNDEKLDKLEAVLSGHDKVLLATLLALETKDRYGALDLTPPQQRARTLQALVDQMLALSEERPVLFVLEDAHWIDASTLEMLDLCLDQIVRAPVLMLITARPTFEHGFGGHPIVTRLTLNRLGLEQVREIVDRVTGGKALPQELLDEIAAKTDGVPLFVEELTKTLLESEGLRETDSGYELVGALSHLAIPSTLHDSLMARLDRLQPIKEVAQIAACIGRQFDYPLIETIAPMAAPALQDALDKLIAAELIFRRGVVPEASYMFKHALVRDAAYESLLKTRRQAIHAKLVDAMESGDKAPPELIAQHATEAGLTEKAIILWQQAGTMAAARPAYEEAISQLNTAIELIAKVDDPAAWRERELELLVQLAQILMAKQGYGSAAPAEVFARAAAMIDATQNMELRVAISYGMWIGPYIRAEHDTGLALAGRFVDEVDRQDADVPRLIAHRMRAATLISLGRSGEALEDLKIAYNHYQQDNNPDFASRFAQEPGVQIQCYQLLSLWMLGYADQALAVAKQASDFARELSHANTICYTGLHCSILALWCRDDVLLQPVNNEFMKIAREHEMTMWLQYGAFADALFRSRRGDEAAMGDLESAFEEFLGGGNRLFLTFYIAEQAKEFLRLGRFSEAVEAHKRALDFVAATSERWAEAELYRIEGDLQLAESDDQKADASYRRAIEVAREQGARLLELRAATSLAGLWHRQGETGQARDLLTPIYGWFTEGFDTADLKDAKAVLDKLI